MSIFGTIMSKVFGHHAEPSSSAPADAAPAQPAAAVSSNTGSAAGSAPPPVSSVPSPDTTAAASTPTATPATGGGSGGQVDVAEVLDGMENRGGQKLDWRHSIVDLMKLLDMDSSWSARKELAHELNYTGDTSDSAAMNIWLHKEVMQKFAANGGKLPSDLAHT